MKFTDKQIAEAKRRVGVLVSCDKDCNVSAYHLADAVARAEAHLGGPVELIEREGIWFPNMGGSTHITFRLVQS